MQSLPLENILCRKMESYTCMRILHALFGLLGFSSAVYSNVCGRNIYCDGPLLHTVQMAGLFNDSKTFVDMKLKYAPEQVLKNFELFMSKHQEHPSKEDVRSFVNLNFDKAGSEFVPWVPDDWRPNPVFLDNITDPRLRSWATHIHSYWKQLGRKIKEDVKNRPELYSMIYTSNPVIVPGGRFREFYYWDSHWIIKGLLLSEMHTTVRGMLENFIEMVNFLGYVPNGGRVYFQRSQPPLLIPMVKLYIDKTNDIDFLRRNLPALEKEFQFWIQNRSYVVNNLGKSYRVIRYNVECTGPRPESYREDYELAEKVTSEAGKEELYFNLKSAAESGWDFSSRWFVPPVGVHRGNISDTKVRSIIPVELNAIIQLNAKLLADFYRLVHNPSESSKYDNLANEWKTTINELLWDEALGCWFDFNIESKSHRKEFYPSNLSPLWTGTFNSPEKTLKVLKYLKNSGAVSFPGGVPTSLAQTGEQWDFPNGWAPLQHLIVHALDKSENAEAQTLAFEITEKWISSNYMAFTQSNHMFEKYDVTVVGLPGGGGEYDVVVGFGWTNGVALDFLDRYGDKLRAPVEGDSNATNQLPNYTQSSLLLGGVMVLLVSLIGISQFHRYKKIFGIETNRCDGYAQLPVYDDDGKELTNDVLTNELRIS